MKTLYFLLFALFPVAVFAQADTQIETFFTTFAALVGLIPVVVEFFKKTLNMAGRSLQIFSWIIGLLLTLAGWFLDLGFLAEIELWYVALMYGFGASLAANGVADTKIIQGIINVLKPKK